MSFGFPSSRWLNAARAARAGFKSDTALEHLRAVEGDLERAQQEVDRLSMIVEAMWSLMRERTGVTDEELGRRVEAIDLRDGKLDGRSVRAVPLCEKCQRPASVRNGLCLYCGHPNRRPLF
jgi:hypothetical protein